MHRGRPLFWLVSGVLGLLLGAAGAIWDVVAFSILSGALALTAGVAVYRLLGLLRQELGEKRQLEDRLSRLEADRGQETRGDQAQAELDAAALAAHIDRTAVRRGEALDPPGLTDPLTGLYSEAYFQVALDGRIATARRHLRPLAVVLLEVIEDLEKGAPRPADAREMANGLREILRESDTLCRLQSGVFAMLLEDTPENGAIWSVERLRRHLVSTNDRLTVWAGIACYPSHGFETHELLDRAELALGSAREWRQDRIEVAKPEPSA